MLKCILACIAKFWKHVLELGLTLWVLRAPVTSMLFGFLILGLAPQAQDLLIDVAAGPWWYVAIFLFVTFFVWAATAHYAARLLVVTDARYLAAVDGPDAGFLIWLQKWAPRIVGSLAFVAMAMATHRSWLNVPTVEAKDVTSGAERNLILLGIVLAAAFALYWSYTAARSRLWRSKPVIWAERLASLVLEPIARRLPPALTLGGPAGARTSSNLGPVILILLFFCFTILPFLWPFRFAEWFPRALAVPFVLAGWTPLAVYASGVGRQLRVPIITLAFIGAWTLSYFTGDGYVVRNFSAPLSAVQLAERSKPGAQKKAEAATAAPANALDRGLGLKAAIDLWKQANACERNTADCPRPIVVAASGGASRAGFFTASVLGKLLDAKARLPGSEEKGPEGVRNRIFAISSVSGSSVGAVTTVAALAASDGRWPCKAKPHSLWHGREVKGWRDCLEVLTSGDYLTPVFAGLVFRDTLRFLGGPDRAALLEQSWERQFADSVETTDGAPKLLTCIGSLECPFLTLRPTVEGEKVNWLPLLLLNGASVSTGQRIVTTVLDPQFEVSAGRDCPLELARSQDSSQSKRNNCPILDHAYDFHWLMKNDSVRKGARGNGSGLDVRLSTAAHNSARFPIISPPGEVRDHEDDLVDRIVDGGYFENFGAQTAVELVRAMLAIDAGLAPFILVISNDPGIPLPDDVQAPDTAEASFLTDLSGPVNAIMNGRNARGTLAVDGVERALQAVLTPECGSYNSAHIRVWPEFIKVRKSWLPWKGREYVEKIRPLSFSWWSSIPVQVRLHEQTEFVDKKGKGHDNVLALKDTLAALEKPPTDCRGTGTVMRALQRR
jgi:hypothetical protein